MQSKIDNWNKEIESITKEYVNAFSQLDNATLNIKPNAKTWSIAQIIEHVIITNQSYFQPLKDLQVGKYKVPLLGRIGFVNDLFGNIILKAVQPETKKKLNTFPLWEPEAGNISEDILQRFQQHQKELAQVIQDSASLLGKNTLISSPVNKNIVYKLPTAFEILVAHERRHLKQAKEVLEQVRRQ